MQQGDGGLCQAFWGGVNPWRSGDFASWRRLTAESLVLLPLRTINRFAADRNNLFKHFRYTERIKINHMLVHDHVWSVLFTVTVNGIKQKIFGDAQVFGELAIAPIDFCSRRSPDIVLPPHPFGNCPSLPSLSPKLHLDEHPLGVFLHNFKRPPKFAHRFPNPVAFCRDFKFILTSYFTMGGNE